MRKVLFISHANPEDNEFSRWLALQLAREGYAVWCDLTKLLGGEVFWENAEEAIRQGAVKFLYVLSTASNDKPGVRSELAVASAVKRSEKLVDFIVPLLVDSLSPSQFNIEIARINAISFKDGWLAGLSILLSKLDKDGVPKDLQLGPAAVSAWWRRSADASRGLRSLPEPLISNWYPLDRTTLYLHQLREGTLGGEIATEVESDYPAVRFERYLASFTPARDLKKTGVLRGRTQSLQWTLNPSTNTRRRSGTWSFRDERATVSRLLRLAWERLLRERDLPTFKFASGGKGFYFVKGQIEGDRISFTDADGSKTWREVIGYKTLKNRDGETAGLRYWHFCLEAKPIGKPRGWLCHATACSILLRWPDDLGQC